MCPLVGLFSSVLLAWNITIACKKEQLYCLFWFFFSTATRPLLRQIENLQHSYGSQQTSWEKLEKNLTERLGIILYYMQLTPTLRMGKIKLSLPFLILTLFTLDFKVDVLRRNKAKLQQLPFVLLDT